MEKIDRRHNYVMVLDTETANTTDQPFVYNLGWAIVDKHGNVYRTKSYVNRDVFCYERELMKSAYYAEKIPLYLEGLKTGDYIMEDWWKILADLRKDLRDYNVKQVCAHNARFDLNALNTTQRWITKSKRRYVIPYGVEIWDTMKMGQDIFWKMPTFRKFCEDNGHFTKTGRMRSTAEVFYQFISGNHDFIESHTALDDVMIEKEILAYCFRQHKKMRKGLFEKALTA